VSIGDDRDILAAVGHDLGHGEADEVTVAIENHSRDSSVSRVGDPP
jgi:hypothetical protein